MPSLQQRNPRKPIHSMDRQDRGHQDQPGQEAIQPTERQIRGKAQEAAGQTLTGWPERA